MIPVCKLLLNCWRSSFTKFGRTTQTSAAQLIPSFGHKQHFHVIPY